MDHDISPLSANFSAGSANDERYPQTWVKSAALFIPQIAKLLGGRHSMKTATMESFKNENSEKLKSALDVYGSDKASAHNYHHLYAFIFDKIGRAATSNVLEIGIGTNNPSLVSTMGPAGVPGASLRAFSAYLANARIFGADVDSSILFTEDRIKTAYVDQLDSSTFAEMQKSFSDSTYDLVIDDGLHSIGANLNTLLFALEVVKDGGWIVIEDISKTFLEDWLIVDFALSKRTDLQTVMVSACRSMVYVVRKSKT